MGNGLSIEEARKMGLLPKRAEPLKPMDAEALRKAGSVEAAVRLQAALEAKDKRAAATKRDHVDKCSIRVIGKPPSINKLLRGARKQMRVREAYKVLCREGWERAGRPVLADKFKLSKLTMWLANKKDDASNNYLSVVKILVDVLKDCGCIRNDSRRFHVGPDFKDGGIEWLEAEHDMVELTLEAASPSGQF